MKSIVQKLSKTGMLLLAIIFFVTVANGATFTAVTSGNWSATATWGGTVPSRTNIGDQVTIPALITVTMDSNITLNGVTASIIVNGTLTAAPNNTLTITQGILDGLDTISVDSVVIGAMATITFTGDFIANNVSNWASALSTQAIMRVNHSLTLAAGNLALFTGGSLTLATNATIILSGGTLSLTGGLLNLVNTYNLTYTTVSAVTGIETTGSSISNLWMNVGAANSVTLGSNLRANGLVTLQSGTLMLNNHNLTVAGDIAATGSRIISSTAMSNIIISSNTSVSGAINFAAGHDTVNNFVVNLVTGNVRVNTNMVVDSTLMFLGGSISIGNDTLQIGTIANVTGATTTSYVITRPGGFLAMHLTAGSANPTSYYVGTPTAYYPALILLNTGSASGNVMVSVDSNVYSQGYTNMGTEISLNQPLVNATWFVQSDISSNLNLNMLLLWAVGSEINGFDRTLSHISHYTSNVWDVDASSAAMVFGGLYSSERDNITSLSPFSVFDDNTVTTNVPELNAKASEVTLYPNPSANNIIITSGKITDDETYMELLDINGHVLGQYNLTNDNYSLSLEGLAPGNYFIRIYNDNTNVVKKIVKM